MPETFSPDGTSLYWDTVGSGPSLLLVHGTTSERTRWQPVLAVLSAGYTLHLLDRRGRGRSGDAPAYSIEREFEDVAAVADAIGGSVTVLGHSYGGLTALEAALRSRTIGRLVLYEPPLPLDGPPAEDDGIPDRLDALIAAGDREAALLSFYRDVTGAAEQEIASLRRQPNWPDRVTLAHTVPREMRSARAHRFDIEAYRDIEVPTLVLLGSDSPPRFHRVTETLQRLLPNASTAVLEGQRHQAINTAPELFADAVLTFLRSTEPG